MSRQVAAVAEPAWAGEIAQGLFALIQSDRCALVAFSEGSYFVNTLSNRMKSRSNSLRGTINRRCAELEHARLAAEVEAERRRLKNIVANVPGVVWEAWGEPDAATQRIDFVSDYVETMLGYSVEEWLTTPNFWLSIVHEDDKERAAREAAARFKSGKGGTSEFRWVARDGRVLWVEARSTIVTDAAGNSAGMLGVTMDITHRKHAEEELRQSEERYRDLVENAHDIIYTHDLEGNYTSINAAAEQITGYTREEALRMNITQTVPPEQLETVRQMIVRKLAGDRMTSYELEIIAKDGRRIPVEVNTALIIQDGVAVGIQGIARDVTERKKLEHQLRQSQKMEAIGLLAGGVAHDFNNLLTAIIGYTDLTIRRLRNDDPLQRNLEEIRKAGDLAASLTRQLLAFSRKQILQPRILDLNSVVAEMGRMLRRLIGEDIELRTVLRQDLGKIKADPGQIEQVIMNLAINARDAMPSIGKLTIETQAVTFAEELADQPFAVSPGSYVKLLVTDTGIGMDEETVARIFEPFFTTKESGRGTGLGLSTVYGIIKQSGGYILVHSNVGRGTTFTVYLPQIDTGPDEYKPNTTIEDPLQGDETILLVEDEDTVRRTVSKILAMYGYEVLEAQNGRSALQLCELYRKPIDLLLTDVVMPEMSGRELANRLASQHPEMKVLYMSGYTDDVIVHHGVLDQGTEFIQKPFTPDVLARRVRDVLDGPPKLPKQTK
jgi:two-component system cell cycle sensor histidine kinase/response regulator CckA